VHALRCNFLRHQSHSPGWWFWRCFEPLRPEFARRHWITLAQPWGATPEGFGEVPALLDYVSKLSISVWLWRPGSLDRWALHFRGESITLWSPREPCTSAEAARLAGTFADAPDRDTDTFIETNADFSLDYLDSTYWEIKARDRALLALLRAHLETDPDVHLEIISV